MELDENTGAVITLQEGKDYIANFGKKYPEEVKGFFMGKNNINKVLEQEGCIGIRIYNGYEATEQRMNQVFVGVDASGSDMTEGVILDRSYPCPSYCDAKSLLLL